ncbi:MAG TPA: hypothetical protein VFJ02_06105 [Vicinamibacterales bacterium]|nr:hypothetical protein [Vicinamibacterales bacterium]
MLTATMAAGGCDNGPDTTPTTPTGPQVTETFTGTVTLNGSITHSFSATSAGAVVATITSISPSTGVLGFQLGTWNTVTCSAVLSNDLATQASVLQGNTQSSASLCVKLHDPNGALADNPVTYTVTVTHY